MRARGYSLPLVLALLLIVTIGVFSFITAVGGGARLSAAAHKERRTFYAADDMCRITAVLAQNYLASTPNPNGPGLEAFVLAQGGGASLPTVSPPGFEVKGATATAKGFEVITFGAAETRALPSGPFEGMVARQRPLDMKVRVQQVGGNAAAACRQKIVLATVAAFQFYIFSEVYLDWDPFPLMTVRGRVHGNEDVCVAGSLGGNPAAHGLVGDRLTAAGRILRSSIASRVGAGLCRVSQSDNNVKFATDGTFTDFAALSKDHLDSDWRAFSESTFGGRVLDSAHNVQRLKLPITGKPRVQAGYNLGVTKHGESVADFKESNLTNQRFVVDPILRTEPPDVREQKFMFKADLRIINGVWYLRDASAPHTPGTAIWSDHPGHFIAAGSTVADPEQGHELFLPTTGVGQEDLRAALGWGSTTPRRFSLYGYDTAAESGAGKMTRLATDPPAVLSYGAVFRDDDDGVSLGGAAPYWYPGHWISTQAGATSLCLDDVANTHASLGTRSMERTSCTTGACTARFTYTNDTTFLLRADTTGAANPVLPACKTSVHSSILNGSRSGFKSGWLEVRSKPSAATALTLTNDQSTPPRNPNIAFGAGVTANERDRSRILPVNIDVAALQAALADCTNKELGSYFPGNCSGSGRVFNGIVYVTATWPGALAGFGDSPGTSGFAEEWPYQGRRSAPADAAAPQATTEQAGQPTALLGRATYSDGEVESMTNQALPYPLCSDDGTLTADQRIFDKIELTPSVRGRFKIPTCSGYGRTAGKVGAFPNAVRIINASKINPRTTTTTAGGALVVPSGVLPKGLTIATNLPMYVLGDVNVDTTPKKSPTDTPANDYFVPVLLAADRITRHSTSWTDADARWGMPSAAFEREPTETTHHFEVFSGWAQSDAKNGFHDDGIENFMKYNERWDGTISAHYFGAMVAGFASVFEAAGTGSVGDGSPKRYGFGAPHRDEGYDFHLDVPENQPPGAPLYNVQGIFLWEAQ